MHARTDINTDRNPDTTSVTGVRSPGRKTPPPPPSSCLTNSNSNTIQIQIQIQIHKCTNTQIHKYRNPDTTSVTGVRSPGRKTPPPPPTIQQVNGQQPDSGKFCTIPDSGKFCTILQNYCHSFRLFRFLSFKNRSKRNHSNNFTFTIYSKVDCLV